ncbi:MAG: methyltransferase domain-containing protein [Anaerolineales bacterium]|jgi:ubiquinone/menaquinone biosynthesis C-methylase UbiE
MGNEHGNLDHVHFFEMQEIAIDRIPADGWILDIGGGGEGVIGLLMGDRVIAIDPSERELREAAEGPLKVIMDAKKLLFLDSSFPVVTSFFTLMYIKASDHVQVFQEIYRVLMPGGEFLIWDGVFPEKPKDAKEIAAFHLKVTLPNLELETGYGTKWPDQGIDVSHYLAIADSVGFEVVETNHQDMIFSLRLKKPMK